MGPGKVNGLIAQFLERIGLTVGGVVAGAVDPTVVSVTAGTGSPASMTSGKRYNNLGTTVKAGLLLPTSPVVGNHIWVTCVDSDGLRITAPSGTTIQLGDATCAAAGYFETVRVGSAVHLVCTSSTTWVAEDVTGTWRKDSTTSAGFAYTPTDWTAWTSPTTTWTTGVTWTGVYRQIGSDLELKLGGAVTGTPTTATLQFDLPGSFTAAVETNDSPTSFGPRSFGIIYDASASTRYAPLQGTWADSNTMTIAYTNNTSTINSVTQAAPMAFAAGDYVLFYATVRLD